MSGGSYNYLAEHEPGDLEARRGSIEAMRDRLAGLEADSMPGAARAARLTVNGPRYHITLLPPQHPGRTKGFKYGVVIPYRRHADSSDERESWWCDTLAEAFEIVGEEIAGKWS
ncbi:hypothetical protein ACIQ7D_17660 [Streptomyces sp. NPDC096310]|uniref:hypothetical protein n=1 Tax=Streptomyces sp. NPDC096310 TaxID=3366082 RepID=UPI0038134488